MIEEIESKWKPTIPTNAQSKPILSASDFIILRDAVSRENGLKVLTSKNRFRILNAKLIKFFLILFHLLNV